MTKWERDCMHKFWNIINAENDIENPSVGLLFLVQAEIADVLINISKGLGHLIREKGDEQLAQEFLSVMLAQAESRGMDMRDFCNSSEICVSDSCFEPGRVCGELFDRDRRDPYDVINEREGLDDE